MICDSEGKPVDVALRQQGESEKLIESFMLAANDVRGGAPEPPPQALRLPGP